MTTLTKQQTSLALDLAIIEGGLTSESFAVQKTRPSVARVFAGVPNEVVIEVGNEELAKLNEMIEQEAKIDEAKTGVRPSNNNFEARWGLKASEEFYANHPKPSKLKIALNVAGFALAIVARKKMADKGMVRSFWYGLPHKPGTFPKNK